MSAVATTREKRSLSPHLPFGDRQELRFYGWDILSVSQFDRQDLDYLFGVAKEMRATVERIGAFDLLKGKVLANLFYEPSTRTSSSFLAAMARLGGSVIPINEVRYSSVAKGEFSSRYRPHTRILRRRHRPAPSRNRRRGPGCQVCPQADHQRRRRRRRTSHAGAAGSFHDRRGTRPPGWADGDHARRPEIWPDGAFAVAAPGAVWRAAQLCQP